MILAIDVDNTLLVYVDEVITVSHDVVSLMRAVRALGLADIVLWSGGGSDYAEKMMRRFGLSDLVTRCANKDPYLRPDITIDDQDMHLGKVNLKLPGDIEATPWMGMY